MPGRELSELHLKAAKTSMGTYLNESTKVVVDLGSGYAVDTYLAELARENPSVEFVGIDRDCFRESKSILKELIAKYGKPSNLNLITADANHLPLIESCSDLTTAFLCPEYENFNKPYKEANRITKKRKYFIVDCIPSSRSRISKSRLKELKTITEKIYKNFDTLIKNSKIRYKVKERIIRKELLNELKNSGINIDRVPIEYFFNQLGFKILGKVSKTGEYQLEKIGEPKISEEILLPNSPIILISYLMEIKMD